MSKPALAKALRDCPLKIDESFDDDGLHVHQQNLSRLHKIVARLARLLGVWGIGG